MITFCDAKIADLFLKFLLKFLDPFIFVCKLFLKYRRLRCSSLFMITNSPDSCHTVLYIVVTGSQCSQNVISVCPPRHTWLKSAEISSLNQPITRTTSKACTRQSLFWSINYLLQLVRQDLWSVQSVIPKISVTLATAQFQHQKNSVHFSYLQTYRSEQLLDTAAGSHPHDHLFLLLEMKMTVDWIDPIVREIGKQHSFSIRFSTCMSYAKLSRQLKVGWMTAQTTTAQLCLAY